MSIEKQIQNKVRELLEEINSSIPIKWSALFVHLEMADKGGTLCFFFKEDSEKDYHYSLQIPYEFNYSKKLLQNSIESSLKLVVSCGKYF